MEKHLLTRSCEITLLIIIPQYMETGLVSLAAATVLFALNTVEKSFKYCEVFMLRLRNRFAGQIFPKL